ncbi:OmpA family protein [Geoalkalibacter sp.]|uniref:OmpA family protein n=1 Tax=Geoalkalibacter sp. TaxID=3041440 RepID=UPI00272EA2D7|nr:OmpA family protein [Geoalkalibacter sp.]
MEFIARILLCALIFAHLAACATNKNLIVLIPDEEGKVGRISVENDQGGQILDQAWSATRIKDAAQAPTKPQILPEAEVRALFRDALAVQPRMPARFLLYFEGGSEQLTEESAALLPQVLRTAQERRSQDISIIGHTDTQGAADFNYALALRRASAIADRLVAAGIAEDFLEIASHGEKNPLIPTADEVLEPRNRRVEIVVR